MSVRAYKLGAAGVDSLDDARNFLTVTKGAGQYATFSQPSGTYYRVPTAKNFYITQVDYSADTAGLSFALGRATASRPDSGTTKPAAFVGISTDFACAVADLVYSHAVLIKVPGTFFPTAMQSEAGNIRINIYGLEF